MTIYIYVLTNYVPAVAVIRKRLVLFIIIRSKGYLDGENKPKIRYYFSRVKCDKVST